MASAAEERSRKLAFRSVAVIVVALLAGLVGAAIVYRRPIAEAVLMRQLRSLGLDQATIAVGRFDSGRLELENLSTGSGDGLEIARIEARFSPRGLFTSRLDALTVSGVRLRGALDEAGPSFGPLDRMLERSAASAGPGRSAALPAATFEIDDAQLELATARGPLLARLELHALEVAPGKLEVRAQLQVDSALAKLQARASAAGSPRSLMGDLEIRANAGGEFATDVSARALSLASRATFAFDAGDLEIEFEDCAEIQIDGLALKSLLALSRPLDLCLRTRSESGIRIAKRGEIDADFELEPADFAAELRVGGESQPVSGKLPASRIRAARRSGEFELSLETKAGQLAFAKPGVGVRDIEIEASASQGSAFPNGSLRVGEIFDTHPTARFPKLALKAAFAPGDDGVAFELEFSNRGRELVVEARGVHELASAAGRADLHLNAINFEPGRLQPSALFPVLSNLLTEASGSIELRGSAEWDADGVRGTAEAAVADVSAKSELASVEHLNAIIELNETGASSLDQIVSVGRLDFGVELTDGLIRYRVRPGGAVAIESASWKFAGGEVTTAGEIDLRSEKRETSLVVKGVDLTELIELVNLEGLSGTGTLEGELPIALVGDEIQIRNAVLRSSDEAGVIRYDPDPGTSNIAAADPRFATALTVLENFHYERLEIEIDGSATGAVVIKIHFAGVNPDYQEGHPVEFNLSVDARLSDLLRTGMRVYKMPEKIEERLRAFSEKGL